MAEGDGRWSVANESKRRKGQDSVLLSAYKLCNKQRYKTRDSVLFGRKKGREDAWFCYIFAGIGDDSGIISFSWVNFLCK